MKYLLVISIVVLQGFMAQATSINWQGQYRFEYFDISSIDLSGQQPKAAMLHRLNLRPELIAADGFRVIGNIEVLPNSLYPEGQVGMLLGQQGVTGADRRAQPGFAPLIRELYLRWEQEYGEFHVGRTPLQFGIGAYYNDGTGLFDHFSDQFDMVGYKIFMGNMLIHPMIARVTEGGLSSTQRTTDQILKLHYDNQDAQAELGILYRKRLAPQLVANSAATYSADTNPSYLNATVTGGYDVTYQHFYFARKWTEFSFRMEAGNESGSVGLAAANGEAITLAGFGLSLEFDYKPQDSKWSHRVLTGIVSGDNPNTSVYEGFQLHRNYDLAFLVTNHPLGRFDAFKSNRLRSRDANNALMNASQVLDEEQVGNLMYIAPQFNRRMSDKLTWTNRLFWGQLVNSSSVGGQQGSQEIGFELDMGLAYRPNERVTWLNEIGLFAPGAAFKEGANEHPVQLIYGWQSRFVVAF